MAFSPQKQMAISNVTTADNGKIQMEFNHPLEDGLRLTAPGT